MPLELCLHAFRQKTLAAPPAAAQALSLADQAPVLSMERLAFDTDHEPIEAMTAYYDLREEYCRLEMR